MYAAFGSPFSCFVKNGINVFIAMAKRKVPYLPFALRRNQDAARVRDQKIVRSSLAHLLKNSEASLH